MNEIPDSERMALDFDGWLSSQDDDSRGRITTFLEATPETERQAAKDRLASQFIVAESSGLDLSEVDQDWDMIRGGFAAKKGEGWLAGVNDESAFHAKVKSEMQFRREERQLLLGPDDDKGPEAETRRKLSLVHQAQEAAFAGLPYSEAFANWQGNSVVSKGWRADRTDAHNTIGRDVYERTAATVEKVKPIAEEAFSKLAALRGVNDTGEKPIPFELFRGLSDDERGVAFRMISEKAKQQNGDKTRLQAFGEGVGRGFENLLVGLALNPLTMNEVFAKKFKAGDEVFGVNVEDYLGGGTEQKSQNIKKAEGLADLASSAIFSEKRKLTEAEAEDWNGQLKNIQEDLRTFEVLRKISTGEIDPTQNVGGFVFQKMVMPVADSTALLAGMATSGVATMTAAAGQYSNENFQRLTQQGMDDAEALKISNVSGLAQAALDKAGFELLKGIPAVNNVLKRFAMSGSVAGRFALNAGTTLAAETGIELMQDHIIPALAQDMITQNPAFDVNWVDVWRETAAAIPETALGMVLLSAGGGAFQTYSESKATRELSNSRPAMLLAGYTDAQIELIQQQPQNERAALLSQFAPSQAPVGAAKDALIARVVDEAQIERDAYIAKLKAETGETSDALDYAVRVTRRQDTGWTVTTESGKNIIVDTAEAARRIRQDLAQASSQREAETLVALVEDWHLADTEAQRETTFTGETATSDGTSIAYKRDGKITREITDERTLETLRREAEIVASQTGNEAVNVIVNGSNQTFRTKVADAAFQVVQRLEINRSASSVLTFLHESMESNWRAGMQNGTLNREATQKAVASIAGAFSLDSGNAETRAFNERVQRVADGTATDDELRETVSELAVADVIGRRKNGGKVEVGSISRAISDAIQRAADESTISGLTKLQGFIRAAKAFFRGVLGTVAAIRKAKQKNGKLAEDWEAFMHKITGTSAQTEYDAGRVEDLNAQLAAANAASDIYVPPTVEQEAAGIAFSASRAKPADTSNVIVAKDGTVLVGPTTFSISPSYGIPHRPNEEGPRAFDLLEGDISPSDVYEHPEWYSAMDQKVIRETMAQLKKARGNENADVVIYRAGPVAEMNTGDWVSLSKEYARTHADTQDPDGYKVWASKVKARDVRWSLDDLSEFGYFGEKVSAQDSGTTFSISAYHGTPHKIDPKEGFKMDRIGTGEGAQVYGHGLYFAEEKATARYYREQLSKKAGAYVDGRPAKELGQIVWEAADDIAALGGDIDAYIAQQKLRRGAAIESATNAGNTRRVGILNEILSEEIGAAESLRSKKISRDGNLYTVELDVEPDELLDWDKPLSDDMRERIADSFRGRMGPQWDELADVISGAYEIDGSAVYQLIAKTYETGSVPDGVFGLGLTGKRAKDASEDLRDAGIPGIRYLDGASRGDGKGTSNFVMFDESRIKITAENDQALEGRTFSVSPARDAEYLAAVERGDMATAQRIVDEAAKAAGYDVKAYHGTNSSFRVFKAAFGSALWFSEDRAKIKAGESGAQGTSKILPVYLKTGRVAGWDEYNKLGEGQLTRDFDSTNLDDDWIIYDPSRIKSAEPVTKAGGNVIPLSQRFNEASNDIRFSVSPTAHVELLQRQVDAQLKRDPERRRKLAKAGIAFSVSPARDAEYMKAVEAGDMDTAQAMVDEAAKAAGYNVGPVYHNTPASNIREFLPFATDLQRGIKTKEQAMEILQRYRDSVKRGDKIGFMNFRAGTFTSPTKAGRRSYEAYGKNQYALFLRVTNPVRMKGRDISIDHKRSMDALYIYNDMNDGGGMQLDEIAIFDPAQIKSADPVTRDESGNVIPLSQRFNAASNDIRFSVSPTAHVELLQRQVDAQLKRDPERRRKLAKAAGDKLQALQFAWETDRVNERGVKTRAIVEQRSERSLNKEQAFREAARREELEAEVYGVYGDVLENESLGQLWGAGPVMEYLSKPDDKLHGRLMSKSQALKSGKFSESNGDYDGIDGVPRVVFGGSLMPDQVAQELFESGILKDASVDVLWDTIRDELKSAARWKGFIKTAKEGLKKAKRQAHEEAAEWRREQDELQREDWNPKARLLRDMRALDAVISVLPVDLRSKVGGFIKLAELTTDKARIKEIERRMKKLGGLVEDHLKKESVEEIERLIEKAEPSTGPGEKPKGKITVEGHRVFAAVDAVRGLTTEQVDAERSRLATAIEDGITKGEDVIDLLEQEQILEMFGAIDKKTAAEADAAASWLDKVYRTGRNAWRMMEEARLAEVADLKEQTVKAIGTASKSGTQEQKKNAAKLKAFAESASFQLLSFTQVLESVVGAGHPLVARWARAAREATNQRTDAILAANARFEKAARDAFGGVSKLEMSRRLWGMSNDQRISLPVVEGGRSETLTVPIEKIRQFEDGSVNPADLGYSPEEAADLIDQLNALPEKSRKKNLSVERILPGETKPAKYTEAEVLALTMLAKQEQYLPNLEKHGYTAEVIEAAESSLSDAAKAIRSHLLKEYADGYAPLSKVFRDMFGIDLPSVANYSPAAFLHAGETRDVDPFGGMVAEGGFRAGFLKSRKEHLAAPRIENALQTWQGHVAQTEHWRAFAPLVRELRAVFGSVDVKDSILSNRGAGLANAAQAWVSALEQNGLQQRAFLSALNPVFRYLTGKQATLTLAWKAGTLIKQSLAAISSAARLPAGVWLRGMSRVMSGKIDVSAIRNSQMIQRRIESGFSPEVRAAMVSLFNGKPSVWSQFVQAGMQKIGEVDAFFASIGTAIVYDYHYNEGLKNGMSEDAAREMALVEAEDNLGRTAQPVELMDRSLYELGMSPAERVGFMFASNQRKDSALILSAWAQYKRGNITGAQFGQTLAVAWLAVGFGSALLGAAWRDANDDDDDAWLDWDNWNPVDISRQALLGPLGGIPLLNMAYNSLLGYGPNDPFKPVKQMKSAVAKIGEGDKPEPVEKTVRRVVDAVNGAAVFVPKMEGIAIGANIMEQAFNLADNFVSDTEDEATKKEKAALAKERKAAKGE